MKRRIKLFTIYAFTIYMPNPIVNRSQTDYIIGNFSNLKSLYNILKGKNLKSYSYISKELKKELIFSATDVKLKIKNRSIFCNKIIIKTSYLNDINFIDEIDLMKKTILQEMYQEEFKESFSKKRYIIQNGKIKSLGTSRY